jgi:hypothetical protein
VCPGPSAGGREELQAGSPSVSILPSTQDYLLSYSIHGVVASVVREGLQAAGLPSMRQEQLCGCICSHSPGN